MSRSTRQYSANRNRFLTILAIAAAALPLSAQEAGLGLSAPASKPAPEPILTLCSSPGGCATRNPLPTPRLADGKLDLGGKGVWAPIWVHDWADVQYVDKAVNVPFTPLALKLYQERTATLSKDDPEG